MQIVFMSKAIEDLDEWEKSGNVKILRKIVKLTVAIQKDAYEGIGKPEELKHELSGFWSRRINQEHRIVYEVLEDENRIYIHSLKGHY